MSTFGFFQVECPKCHGQLNSISSLSGPVKCIYCGTDFHITGNMTKETEAPEQIVPFSTSANDFEQAAIGMLVNGDYAPANISNLISFRDIKGFYLPVFLYEGRYECSWSCKVRQEADTSGDSPKSQKETYRLQDGVSKGDYTFVCLAYDGVETSKELAEYVRTLNDDIANAKSFLPDDLNGYFFLGRNQDNKKTWSSWGEDTLQGIARKNCLTQLQNSNIKDFKCNVTSGSLHEGQFILFPVWMVNYEYDGEPQHIMMDGTGRNSVRGTVPVDHTLKAKAEKPFLILKFIAAAAIVVPLIMLLASWYTPAIIALAATGLVFFIYRYYACWHKGWVIRKARKQRVKMING